MLWLLPLPLAWLGGALIAARAIVPAAALIALAVTMPFLRIDRLPDAVERATGLVGLTPAESWALATVASVGLAAWLAAETSVGSALVAANDNAGPPPAPMAFPPAD